MTKSIGQKNEKLKSEITVYSESEFQETKLNSISLIFAKALEMAVTVLRSLSFCHSTLLFRSRCFRAFETSQDFCGTFDDEEG